MVLLSNEHLRRGFGWSECCKNTYEAGPTPLTSEIAHLFLRLTAPKYQRPVGRAVVHARAGVYAQEHVERISVVQLLRRIARRFLGGLDPK